MTGPDAERLEAEALEQASKPRGCASCGLTFGSGTAYRVHRDASWPGGCLPPGAAGQLVDVDGVWVTRAQAGITNDR